MFQRVRIKFADRSHKRSPEITNDTFPAMQSVRHYHYVFLNVCMLVVLSFGPFLCLSVFLCVVQYVYLSVVKWGLIQFVICLVCLLMSSFRSLFRQSVSPQLLMSTASLSVVTYVIRSLFRVFGNCFHLSSLKMFRQCVVGWMSCLCFTIQMLFILVL